MNNLTSQTIDISEIEKFAKIADEWWDLNGKFKPLHRLNPVRMEYIKQAIMKNRPFEGVEILDIGCGGGLLCEPLHSAGAIVTGIDAGAKNIAIAKLHAKKLGLDINYLCVSAEEIAATGKKFDVVLNMEVIEHVADVEVFMAASCQLVKPGGLLFMATLNRTLKSFALAIIGAEYVLNWLPRGTHNWEKFLKPSEINSHLEQNNMQLQEIKGVSFNLLKNEWHISNDIAVNYMLCAKHIK